MSPRFRNLLIDLDDTLAAEWDFVSGGYRAAAGRLARETGQSESALFNRFVYEHMKYGRRGIIDRVVAATDSSPSLTAELVEAYRTHLPRMHFYAGALEALQKLVTVGCRLAVVTDGAVDVQRRKVYALGLAARIPVIVYCMDLNAPKPDPSGFAKAMELLDAKASDTLIVGDDPLHDLVAAERLGIPSCRVRTGRYALVESEVKPEGDLPAFSDLPAWLGVERS